MTVDPYAVIANELSARRRPGVACFAALGDSFTAGRGCPLRERWADRLARGLRRVHGEVAYANLALDGATSEEVLAQVGPALQLEPDLVTVICGANDVLLSLRPDLDGYERRFAAILERLLAGLPRVRLLTATAPETWRFMALGPRTRARVAGGIRRLNDITRAVAAARGVPVLDVVGHPGLEEQGNFLDDGLHPSPAGHARAALELAGALRAHYGIETRLDEEDER